jgi:hypothetical protein
VLSALSTTATYLLPATAAGVIVLLVLRRSRALGVEQ